MASNVQDIIGYQFSNIEKLQSALQAAHRGTEGSQDDGNRALSMLGLHVVDTIQTFHIVEDRKGTRKDINTRDHWFNDKKRRAAACKISGIVDYILQSPRQQHEEPSEKVRANAMSAIIGAVWLDLLALRDISASVVVEKISEILDRIHTVIWDKSESHIPTDEERPIISQQFQHTTYVETPHLFEPTMLSGQICSLPEMEFDNQIDMALMHGPAYPPLEVPLSQEHNSMLSECSGLDWLDLGPEPLTAENTYSNVGSLDPNDTDHHQEPSIEDLYQQTECFGHSIEMSGSSSNALVPAKRQLPNDHEKRPDGPTVWERLAYKELEKANGLQICALGDLEALLYCSEIGNLCRSASQEKELKFLYFAIGSSQSLIGFANILRAARNASTYSTCFSREGMSSTERYRKITLLSDQEALCVILRRYHTVKLFQTEQDLLDCNQGIIMEDPSTISVRQKAPAGSPLSRAKAQLTDVVLEKIRPKMQKETEEYQKIRAELKRLRRLAAMLQVWTDTYGFGILALFPSSPSWSSFNLTDSMLLSLGEKRNKAFSELVYQRQGSILKDLSAALHPAVIALANGDLVSPIFPIESKGAGDILERFPKGSREIFDALLSPTNFG